jgi:2-polyprenyl-6-hydroxyphenyl methylase/3-demethylubiquinone-9 3-methyltransferase
MKNIDEKKRFEFGKNWSNFLTLLNEERILEAENSLKKYLNLEILENKSYEE